MIPYTTDKGVDGICRVHRTFFCFDWAGGGVMPNIGFWGLPSARGRPAARIEEALNRRAAKEAQTPSQPPGD